MADKKKDIKRYKCINFGACAKADSQEIIEFDAMDVISGTPVCPCCHQNTLQEEITGGDTPWGKYIAIGVGALVVIGGGIYGVSSMKGGKTTPESITLNHVSKELVVGEKDTLKATIAPEGAEGTFVWKRSKDSTLEVSDGIVTALKEGTGKIQVALEGVDGVKEAICEYTIKAKDLPPVVVANPPQGDPNEKENVTDKNDKAKMKKEPKPIPPKPQPLPKKNLGYGSFSGPLKNGKPNGMGTLRYTTSHLIDSRDPKGRVAQPGDYVTGEWKDGKLIQGRWFGSDNTVKGSLMIGM